MGVARMSGPVQGGPAEAAAPGHGGYGGPPPTCARGCAARPVRRVQYAASSTARPALRFECGRGLVSADTAEDGAVDPGVHILRFPPLPTGCRGTAGYPGMC